jgi:hypothetical protein
MGARRPGTEIEIRADRLRVVVVMRMSVLALMNVRVRVGAAVGVMVRVFVGRRRRVVHMLMPVVVTMRVAMHGPVRMNVRVLVPAPIDRRLTRSAAAYRAHRPPPIRSRFP